jgi:hypothetical protein
MVYIAGVRDNPAGVVAGALELPGPAARQEDGWLKVDTIEVVGALARGAWRDKDAIAGIPIDRVEDALEMANAAARTAAGQDTKRNGASSDCSPIGSPRSLQRCYLRLVSGRSSVDRKDRAGKEPQVKLMMLAHSAAPTWPMDKLPLMLSDELLNLSDWPFPGSSRPRRCGRRE